MNPATGQESRREGGHVRGGSTWRRLGGRQLRSREAWQDRRHLRQFSHLLLAFMRPGTRAYFHICSLHTSGRFPTSDSLCPLKVHVEVHTWFDNTLWLQLPLLQSADYMNSGGWQNTVGSTCGRFPACFRLP